MAKVKGLIKAALNYAGYEIRPKGAADHTDFKLHAYIKSDGGFDYDAYRRIQTEGNRSKIERVWAVEDNINFVAEYLLRTIGKPRFGICHGTRRGKEQEWFRERLGCDVIGTEISDTATQFPHTIQWDFHDAKPEWIGATDFVYSNSFDHSYDPERCLNTWISCLNRRGLCILEHSNLHEPEGVTSLDPFGASLVLMPYLITQWGKGAYGTREILSAPKVNDLAKYIAFIVIQRFD